LSASCVELEEVNSKYQLNGLPAELVLHLFEADVLNGKAEDEEDEGGGGGEGGKKKKPYHIIHTSTVACAACFPLGITTRFRGLF